MCIFYTNFPCHPRSFDMEDRMPRLYFFLIIILSQRHKMSLEDQTTKLFIIAFRNLFYPNSD